jgi:hypothetical protein
MRLTSLLAALGLVATSLVAATPPASAAGTCSLYVPSKLTISQPYRAIAVTLGPNCNAAGVTDAYWAAFHPTQGQVEAASFYDGDQAEIIDLYDYSTLGQWNWRPGGAFDDNGNRVYQYSPYTDVRLGSYARLTATRGAGNKVTIRTGAARYWQTGRKFINWADARGQIQYRTPGSMTWRSLKEVYSSAGGAYSYTYTTTAARDYRVVLRSTGTIWGSISPVVRR